ncbi:ABC-type sugar transport system, periplasmic component [Denitrovibrio acetiphilus DSM 12809]|uniref:ABC-type sugar transport system, periplasmic component n=1 Tax=Denitrovibrio acetiphilus (strain DSM 12809 / NBRC 114555 / N2460) TaxID=522772 RepID=D4H6H3_DENA2|nr:substrate-binding domain-containing protein [Denitrovibrio acetiphilus]ADD69647.1 ABC-type sugar transport system, periplasmic component [Denitrovibrio acetiphilus DSM 12809]
MFIRGALILLLYLVSAAGHCFDAPDIYTISEYFKKYPQQKAVSEQFSNIVSDDGKPIRFRQQKPVRIAVVYPAIQNSSYWHDSVKAMGERLNELGIRYELLKYYSKPSGDYRLQALQLTKAASNDVDYLAVSADSNSIRRLMDGILAKGKPKVIIQNLTTPLKKWDNYQPFMYVGFDHLQGARMLSEHYSYIYPKGGKYVMLYGSKGAVSSQRGGGFEKYSLAKGLIPAAKFYTDFDPDKTYKAAASALSRFDDLSFFYACSTDIALGALKAVEDAGRTGQVLVSGWGGTAAELDLIKRRKLDFTVMRMNDDNGIAIAEAIRLDMEGTPEQVPQIFSGKFVMVTNSMSTEMIDNLRARALRYSDK